MSKTYDIKRVSICIKIKIFLSHIIIIWVLDSWDPFSTQEQERKLSVKQKRRNKQRQKMATAESLLAQIQGLSSNAVDLGLL